MDEQTRLKPYKKEFDISYTLGVFPTLELIAARPEAVERFVLSPRGEKNEGIIKILNFAKKSGIPALFEPKTLVRISSKDNCFAAGVFKKYICKLRADANHLVLVNPSDMGNLGTILRTAAAFGVEDVAIISPAADIYDPKVIRASMGAIFRVNFFYFNTFKAYINSVTEAHNNHNREKTRALIPFMLEGQPIWQTAEAYRHRSDNGRAPFSLIFGNEASGLPAEFLSVGSPVRIVHTDAVDSLNLPMAVGIGLYTFTDMNKGEYH